MDSTGKSTLPMIQPAGERFPKSARIHSSLEFDQLFQNGKVVADAVLVMHACTTSQPGRIGISISKRVSSAPVRNRWKRLIREAYRRQVGRCPALARLDIVVRPRRGASADYHAIERSLGALAQRLDKQFQVRR